MIVKLLLIDLDLSVARNHSAAKSAYFDWSSANRIKEARIQDEWDHWGGCSAKSATIDLTIVLQKLLCLPTIELIALQDLNLMLHDLQDSITPFEMSYSWPFMLILVFQKLKVDLILQYKSKFRFLTGFALICGQTWGRGRRFRLSRARRWIHRIPFVGARCPFSHRKSGWSWSCNRLAPEKRDYFFFFSLSLSLSLWSWSCNYLTSEKILGALAIPSYSNYLSSGEFMRFMICWFLQNLQLFLFLLFAN